MNARILSLVILLGTAASSGCAPDRGSLEAFAICAMTKDCTFKNECDLVVMGAIQYDSGATVALEFPIQLNNQLLNNANPALGRVNTNDAHVTGYILDFDPGGPADMTLEVGHHTVPAASSQLVWVYAAPPSSPTGNYSVNISFFGYYDNGHEFETPPFPIALEVGTFTAACPVGEVLTCGNSFQSVYACDTP
jgi:hypothetical protein